MPCIDSSDDDELPSSRTSISVGPKKDRLRVIIVGGSVAGLTLAHCLHHSNVDFVVLEARKEIAPQVGASLVILPNGARILDQLGIFDEIFAVVEPLENGLTWTGDGKLVVNSNAPLLTAVRSVHIPTNL
jgi:2-polyprenyl-6-methoxyphenol hydroxylase-like FAD-dependent oxidoreductase